MSKKIYLPIGVAGAVIVSLVIFLSFRNDDLLTEENLYNEEVMTSDCYVINGEVCFDKTVNQFIVEEGALVTIGVESATIGDSLISKWNLDFPEHNGLLR